MYIEIYIFTNICLKMCVCACQYWCAHACARSAQVPVPPLGKTSVQYSLGDKLFVLQVRGAGVRLRQLVVCARTRGGRACARAHRCADHGPPARAVSVLRSVAVCSARRPTNRLYLTCHSACFLRSLFCLCLFISALSTARSSLAPSRTRTRTVSLRLCSVWTTLMWSRLCWHLRWSRR